MFTKKTPLIIALLLFSTTIAVSQMKVRDDVEDTYQWDLTHLYATEHTRRAERGRVAEDMHRLVAYRGKLAQSAATLREALELNNPIIKELYRLYSYASMKSAQDTRVTTYAGMKQELQQLIAQHAALASYMEPELLALDEAQVAMF